MRSQCLARCDTAAPTIEAARKAIVDAYYELADAYVMMPRPVEGDAGSAQTRRQLKKITALEGGLRDAARALAQEAERSQHGAPGFGPGGSLRQDWLEDFLTRLEALRGVRSTGLTEAHARTLYQLKQTLDQVIDK